jgi:MFS superfamily sulfate permease-like transporter
MHKLLGPNISADLAAGFVIFLIALPLSIGIAFASGAPVSAGILAAIVGGLIGSWTGGTHVSINGPAAGLIIVILGAVNQLGGGMVGFKLALACFILAGAFQVLAGFLRIGSLAFSFPGAVIQGMLAAIGAIIIIKQIPIVLGSHLNPAGIVDVIIDLERIVLTSDSSILLISVISGAMLFGLPLLNLPIIKRIPVPLLVVILGIALAHHFNIDQMQLLNVPDRPGEALIFPDFSLFFTFTNIKWALILGIIIGLESTLSSYAIDKLDPLNRQTDFNRDLISKGFCCMLLGFIGGIPIISEIVRSSANISQGAVSWRSNFFHSFLILAFVLLFPTILARIPMATLASILIVVGFRLANIRHFRHSFKIGLDHFVPFLVTFLGIVLIDILKGLALGLLAQVVMQILQGVKPAQFLRLKVKIKEGQPEVIHFESPVIFTHINKIRKLILGQGQRVNKLVLDFGSCSVVDNSFFEHVASLKRELPATQIEFQGLGSHQVTGSHEFSSRKMN